MVAAQRQFIEVGNHTVLDQHRVVKELVGSAFEKYIHQVQRCEVAPRSSRFRAGTRKGQQAFVVNENRPQQDGSSSGRFGVERAVSNVV